MLFTEKDLAWAQETFEKIDTKMQETLKRTKGMIPYRVFDGKFEDMVPKDVRNWTNGFWGGLLWVLYNKTKNEAYREAAQESVEILDGGFAQYERLTHDVGFLWHITSGLDYKLTGNEKSRVRSLWAASILMSRFNIDGGYLRAWTRYGTEKADGWAIIDTMMNLPLLYWASDEIGDRRFEKVAQAHAQKTLKHHIRPDGSVKHIVIYNEETGEEVEERGGQGYDVGTSWSRGQAWAIYGMIISYNHTKNKDYLDACKRVANYFIACVHEDWLPRCDFKSPAEPVYYDASAGAIAACGMLDLAKVLEPEEGRKYAQAALSLLKAMDKKFCNWNVDEDGMVHYGTVRYHGEGEQNHYLVYSDFYYTEAITKILGSDLVAW